MGSWPGSGVQYVVCWWFPQTLVSGRGPSSSPTGSCSPWCASCCTVYGIVVGNRYWNPRHQKPFSLGFICGSKHLFSIAMSLTVIIPIHKREGKCSLISRFPHLYNSNFNHTEHNGNKCVTDPLISIGDGTHWQKSGTSHILKKNGDIVLTSSDLDIEHISSDWSSSYWGIAYIKHMLNIYINTIVDISAASLYFLHAICNMRLPSWTT